MADETEGSVVALADKILLDTAVTDSTHTVIKEEESVTGVKPSISKDEVGLGGIQITDHKENTTTHTVTHTGSSISGNKIVLKADSDITLINADLAATGEDGSLTLDSSVLTVTGIQDTQKINHAEETEVATMTVGVRNAYVDTAYAVKAVEEAGEEVDRARRALSDAERAYDRGEISAGARDDYKGMLAMATANLIQAELAATQALATAAVAAGSSAGTGFYVSGSAQVTETRSESNDDFATWQGSTLSAATMSINADVASLIGSDVNAGTLDLNADNILLGAGTHTQSNSFEQDSRNVGVGVSTSGAGSWNANAGYNEASSNSDATQHVNTQINVSHLNSTSDELTLRGAVVTANTANITTGTLTVESLQDTHKSKNSSMGVNVGVGAGSDSVGKPQSGSGGANFAKGDSEGAITNEQSAILIANGADSQITANDTHLIGGMIANATWAMPEGADENTAPVLVDHGQLNFTTGTLTTTDLRDYSKSSQTGAGIQTNFGVGVYDGTEKQLEQRGSAHLKGEEYVSGSTSVSLQSEGHRMEGKTLATIGGGNITVGGVSLDEHEDFTDLNRDVEHAQVVTLDQQTGAMNGSMSVDHRLFSEAGRQVIKDQHIELKDNFKATAGGLAGDVARVGTVVASVGQITQMGNSLERINGAQETAYREDGELAAETEAFREGKIEDSVAAQELLNTLDGMLNDGNGSRVQVTDGAFNPDGNLVAGAANVDTNTLYADMGENARGSMINTLAHEGMHLDGAGEWMAGVTGYLADFTYRANAWANSSAINSHGPIYVPVQDALAHQDLLSQNMGQFVNDAANGRLDYRQLNRHEMGAVLSPDNQLRYQMMRQAMGLPPSDNPSRDLYIAAVAAVDEQAAGIVRPDYTATLAINALRAESAAAGTSYQNDSGSINAMFEASSVADFASPLVNSTSLYNEEQFNAFPVKDFLLLGLNEYGQHDLYSQNYRPAMAEANRIAGDALRDQTLMILGGSLAAPAVISGAATTYGLVTTQGQFWAGTASHIGLRGAQSAGAHVSTSVSLLSHKAQAAYQFGSSYFYTSSSGALIANPKVQQGVLDFIDGLVVPGTPAPSLFGYGGWAYGVAATIGQEGD